MTYALVDALDDGYETDSYLGGGTCSACSPPPRQDRIPAVLPVSWLMVENGSRGHFPLLG